MEMRAIEDITIGEDLTPPLPPLASVLHRSALGSYCSACFSTLPPQPFSPFTPTFPQNCCHVPIDTPTPLYCSPNCSSIDSPLHFSSAEPHLISLFIESPPSTWNDSSDLRLSLRLLHMFRNPPEKYSISPRFIGSMSCDQRLLLGGKGGYPFQENENNEDPNQLHENRENSTENMERIVGLMTNRENLVFGSDENPGIFEGSDENTEIFLERIKEGAKMMANARRICVNEDDNVEKEEVFVLEEMVLCLVLTNAVEVHDRSGSSIGVAVYDTSFSWINHSCSPNACYRFLLGRDGNEPPMLRIKPAAKVCCVNGGGSGLTMEGDLEYPFSERIGYGPRVVVRSIKDVSNGEEVTIAYTDLLQPKETRQAGLWLKYRFCCSCRRCSAMPTAYVDHALQALSADTPDSDNETEDLMQNYDNAIKDYLSFNDPKSCCNKLENLLCHGDLSDRKETKLHRKVKLHPFHHLSLDAYTTLASAYKVQASDLLAHNCDVKLEAFNMYKTSSAYSLLLVGVVHHLFTLESALIMTVSNFWMNAGESMVNLARSPLWDSFSKRGLIHFHSSWFYDLECNDCCIVSSFEEVKSRVFNCISDMTGRLWSFLAPGSCFLRFIRNPIDLSWLASPVKMETMKFEDDECGDQLRMDLFLLSLHCLRYGALLSSICNGLSVEVNYYTSVEIIKGNVKF